MKHAKVGHFDRQKKCEDGDKSTEDGALVLHDDSPGIPNLESLILEGCTILYEVHPSLGHHKKLKVLNLVGCNNLRILLSDLAMESLKICTLDGCSKLEKFPDIVGNMNCLRDLRLDWTGIEELPSSIHHLVGLDLLSMSNCKNLRSIPNSIGGLKSLKKLDLSGCSELTNVPENLGKLESLEEFDASGTSIRQPPASFFLLQNLKVLSFDGCKRITVNLTDQELPSLSGLSSLQELNLCACNLGEGAVPKDIGCLMSLRCLDLSRNNFVCLPKSLNQLSGLEILALEDCMMLESLPEVPSKVQTVNLNGCMRLKDVPDLVRLSSLKRLEFKCLNCWELYEHNGQDGLGLTILKRYLQGSSNPRPGFSVVVPGYEILGWSSHQSKGSSISVQVPSNDLDGDNSGKMGFVAYVAFSAYGEISSLFCHFKTNGRENYPSPMCINFNSIQVLSDHLWLFYLSFDYLKELEEWQHESFSNIELSFRSYDQGVEVKNCGVSFVHSSYPGSSLLSSDHLFLASEQAASAYIASLDHRTSSYSQWMHDVFLNLRGTETSNNIAHLYRAQVQRGPILGDQKLDTLKADESRLLQDIEEAGLSIIIFARDYAYSHWWLDKFVMDVSSFMREMGSDIVFPVFYVVKRSKKDEQTYNYIIVFDKDEGDFSENGGKVHRWIDILRKVAASSGSGSSERLMAIFSKILRKEDIRARLAVPTKCLKSLPPFNGGRSVHFQARDEKGTAWIFRCLIRNGNHHPKPFLIEGWLAFVRDKNLEVGDKVMFYRVESQAVPLPTSTRVYMVRIKKAPKIFGAVIASVLN